jgi:hypothetical protein
MSRAKCAALLLCSVLLVAAASRADDAAKSEPVKIGATYNRAQVVAWLDSERFIVGRWDGSLTVFRLPVDKETGPVLTAAFNTPSGRGIEMIQPLGPDVFVTSNDNRSMIVWRRNGGEYRDWATLIYDKRFGVAESACALDLNGEQWLVTGHEAGVLKSWKITDGVPVLQRIVDLRSPDPIPAPFRLWNVRTVARLSGPVVVTGSEDGDLCFVDVAQGKLLSRMRYSPTARRGINSVAVSGNYLLVGSCPGEKSENNLWLFKIDGEHAVPLDSTNLSAKERSQAFVFCVLLTRSKNSLTFFASTEEGLLWRGEIVGDKLRPLSKEKVDFEGGAALAVDPAGKLLAAVGHAVEVYRLRSD